MPDLAHLQSRAAQSTFIIYQLIGVDVGFPSQMADYRRNFVRLVDKAVRDYSDARTYVEIQIRAGDRPSKTVAVQFVFDRRICDKLEDCITTVRRLFRYFEKIKSDPARFPIGRSFRKLLASVEGDLRKIRDLIEHLDKNIRDQGIKLGQNIAPVLNVDASVITLAGAQLRVSALAQIIEKFHSFATNFAQYQIASDGSYQRTPKSGPVR